MLPLPPIIFLLLFSLILILSPTTLAFSNPLVALDYGRFQGRYDAAYNISYFRKIPFGASTAGANRFLAPQLPAPLPQDEVYDTDQDFDMCPQRTVNGSEDCLYLGIYSRPWDTAAARAPPIKRPVVVVFYGGGFIQGSASFTLPPSAYPVLNESMTNDFVVVYPNYRTNAFGFLPGRAVKEAPDADLNVGLLDQAAALRWVRRWIGAFGGDEGDVTIWGQSAGGGSVVAQVLAQAQRERDGQEEGLQTGGEEEGTDEEQDDAETTPKLFHRALASSPFWPKTYRYDDTEAEALYAQLVNLTGCSGSPNTLACLKAADVQAIRTASLAISGANTNTTSSFNWAPVIDGEFLKEPLSALTTLPVAPVDDVVGVWATYNTHEGENFVPADLSSENTDPDDPAFAAWLRGYLPRFDETQLAAVEALYPLRVDGEAAADENELDILNSTRVRAGRVYRDSVLTCPGLWVAQAAATAEDEQEGKSGDEGEGQDKAYLAEYTIAPAKHGSDTVYWNRINPIQQSDPFIYHGYAGAFGRFFTTGNPNLDPSSPLPPPLDQKPYTAVPPLQSGREWVVKSEAFETRDVAGLRARCDFWKANAADVPI